MIPGAITIYHHATKAARSKGFVGNEVGGDRSYSVVIGSRLAAIGPEAAELSIRSKAPT
jgi:hypothetical protein